MLVFTTVSEFTAWRDGLADDVTVALVPTMGALHEGHAQLIREASLSADETVVTIFVNRIQFTNASDFEQYPKTFDHDVQLAENSGATVIFTPLEAEMSPLLEQNRLTAGHIGTIWEGKDRPRHFDGVLTVVNQLFALTRPHQARFGKKDRQQMCIISSWAKRAWPTISIDAGATVRDDDGLALSSRNRRLSQGARRAATSIPKALRNVQRAYLDGTVSVAELESVGRASLSSECVLHYLTVVDPVTLERKETATQESIVIIAATLDGVRLIDNMDLSESLPASAVNV